MFLVGGSDTFSYPANMSQSEALERTECFTIRVHSCSFVALFQIFPTYISTPFK